MRIENYQFILTLYLRQCDKSIQDTFDDGMSQSKNVKVNTNNQRAANWSEEKKSDNKNDTNPNINVEGLTGSELVRKYVTFHFFFPVGQHHPAAGNPLLTKENGLFNYQANCDKVCYNIFLASLLFRRQAQRIIIMMLLYLCKIATSKCKWNTISWSKISNKTICFISIAEQFNISRECGT